MDEQAIAVVHGLDERDLDAGALALVVLAERERANLVDPDDPHGHGVIAARDADVVAAVAHSITLALSSASSCS